MTPPTAVDIHAVTDTTTIALPDPLTVNDVSNRRAKAGKFLGGVAAFTMSDFFKDKERASSKPMARRWDHILSIESVSRKPSSLKATAGILSKNPGLISLGGGLPSSDYFPIERLAIKVPSVPNFSEEDTRVSGKMLEVGKHDVSEGIGAYDLSIALNYGQGTGSAQMLRFVTEHTEIVHNPPYQDWQCCMTVGNTSSLDMALTMFTSRGDYILSEEYMFCSAVETARPMGVKVVGIKMDSEGLIPEVMDKILTEWDLPSSRRGGAKKPCVLYTVPTGQNPTGATQSVERRRKVYEVCRKHDVYILEDEPYYFLQMQPYRSSSSSSSSSSSTTTQTEELRSHTTFLQSLIPSLLSMDVDGRVMRLDSFSKVIAPGTRTGWITASAQIVERYVRHNETSVQNPSGLSQMVLYKLLDVEWGHGGFLEWLMYLRKEYTRRRDVILNACERELTGDGGGLERVVQWNVPRAGMFLWFKFNWYLHPLAAASSSSIDDIKSKNRDEKKRIKREIEDVLFDAFISKGVLLVKGRWFLAEQIGEDDDLNGEKSNDKNGDEEEVEEEEEELFFRATFAAAQEDAMKEGIKRVGEALREEFQM